MPDIYNKEYRKNRLRLFRRNLFYGTRYKSMVIEQKGYKTNTHDICFHFFSPVFSIRQRRNKIPFFLVPSFVKNYKTKKNKKILKKWQKTVDKAYIGVVL